MGNRSSLMLAIACLLVLLMSTSHASAQDFFAEDVELDTGTGKLAGTLVVPATPPPFPVAIIVAGSGPTDRDGNSAITPGKNESLKMLAHALATSGVASLRYDKRGVGASKSAAIAESELVIEDFSADVASWYHLLVADDRFSDVAFVGHSEGSLLALIAAGETPVNKVVSLAGAGYPADEILRTQLKEQLTAGSYAEADSALTEIANKGTTDIRPVQGASLFRSTIQPYLHSWFAYDPAKLVSEFPGAVLVVQGTTDIQVSVDNAERLADAKPGTDLAIIVGMNHILKMVPADRAAQLQSYGNPGLPISEELITQVVSFLRN